MPIPTWRRLWNLIGRGDQGRALARALARRGIKTRKDLLRPDVFAALPRESQASVKFRPRRGATLREIQAVVAKVKKNMVFVINGSPRRFEIIPVGSIRRQEPRAKDIDILVVAPAGVADRVLAGARSPLIADTYSSGDRQRSFILHGGGNRYYRADFFVTTPAEKAYALFHRTGSRHYNIRTRAVAKRRGWLLNQYGLFVAAHPGRRVPGSARIRTERALANFLGVTFRQPSDRK